MSAIAFLITVILAVLVFLFGLTIVLMVLGSQPASSDVMHQVVGDAPRFQRHVRSVEEEA